MSDKPIAPIKVKEESRSGTLTSRVAYLLLLRSSENNDIGAQAQILNDRCTTPPLKILHCDSSGEVASWTDQS